MPEHTFTQAEVLELLGQAFFEDGSLMPSGTDNQRRAAAESSAEEVIADYLNRRPKIEPRNAIRITAEDLSGKQDPQVIEIQDNYVVICAGTCYVAHENHYPTTGTVQLTIKGVKK